MKPGDKIERIDKGKTEVVIVITAGRRAVRAMRPDGTIERIPMIALDETRPSYRKKK